MDEIFRNAPRTTQPLYVWRGVAVPSFADVDLQLDIFKSLSLSADLSRTYLRERSCCLMRVLIPTGTPLISIDAVQSHKKNGGLFEFVLPRGAVFRLDKVTEPLVVATSKPIYEVTVEFDAGYDQSLAIGRLRRRKRTATDTPISLDEEAAVNWLSKLLFDRIDRNYGVITPDKSSRWLETTLGHFRKAFVREGTRWRLDALSDGESLTEESFVQLMEAVRDRVVTRLRNATVVNGDSDSHPPNAQRTTFLQMLSEMPVIMNDFYTSTLKNRIFT